MNHTHLILTLLITVCLPVYSQISFGGLPSSLNQSKSLRLAESIPSITISPDTTEEVEANQFAYPNHVNIDITKAAAAAVNEGDIIYRLMIHSENAKSINLIFTPIVLPDKAKLFLYRPDGAEIYGAYTNKSYAGDVLATTPVSGDSIMIQFEVPIANADSFSATISSVNTGFEELRKLPSYGHAKACETNAICQNEGIENQCRAVCLIIIDGIRFCSGTLIATDNNDSESFVLSSAHCLRDYSNSFDSTLANKCVFYFGYNTPICETDIIGSYERGISGSKVASSHPEKDMVLLKLSQRPPVDYMTYESGWNITMAPQGPVKCLHHPNGDLMKISISENDPSPISWPIDGLAENTHWLIDTWNVGITESGSSGSPLYDNNGLIIGALSGGDSYCDNRGNDKFWRLNNVWDDNTSKPVDIMSVLDPSLSGISILNGKESYEKRCYSLKNYDSFSEPNEPYQKGYGYASGTNSFGLEEFAEKFTSPYASTEIHGVSFIPFLGKFDANIPVYLRIYTGNEKPETIVYESVIKVTAREFNKTAGGFSNSTVKEWSYKENYIRLDSVVTVGNTFFVSLFTDYENKDFAMLATTSDTKTAFFKKNGVWESWENHPFDNSVGSLLINTIVRKADLDGTENITNNGIISIYPNPAKSKIHIKCAEEINSVRIVNADGQLIIQSHHNIIDTEQLANGIYSTEIITDKGKYHTKFIKE